MEEGLSGADAEFLREELEIVFFEELDTAEVFFVLVVALSWGVRGELTEVVDCLDVLHTFILRQIYNLISEEDRIAKALSFQTKFHLFPHLLNQMGILDALGVVF